MAKIKKNAIGNILFPMVDKTDFASIESGITASDFESAATKKFYGMDQGASDIWTSGTLSLAVLLVRSGIFQQQLEAAATNYDYVMYRFIHPSCADQLLVFETATYDDSDIHSYLVGISGALSDVESQVDLLATSDYLSEVYSDLASKIANVSATIDYSDISDIASAVWADAAGSDLISKVAVIQSTVSDIDSLLEAGLSVDASSISDITSAVEVMIETAIIPLGASNISDVASRVWADTIGTRVDSRILVLQSSLSDVDSQVLLNASAISDLDSALASQTVWTSAAISDMHSDVMSGLGNISVTLTASDISDIASAVTAAGVEITDSDMSDIASRVWATTIGTRVDSRILVAQSTLSDIDSQLLLNASAISDVDSQVNLLATSDYLSAVHSDLASAIGAVAVTVTASDMSDIASRVWATTEGTRVDSRILVMQSNLSDVDSQLTLHTSTLSDIYSLVDNVDSQLLLNASAISDIDSQMTLHTSTLSDIDSQVTANYNITSDVQSQLDLNASIISDIDSQLTLTVSQLSDVESAVDALFTTALTESYNVDGAAPTAAQALCGILQTLTEFSITGTTLTVKKLDGSTTAMTLTLDDGTNPTSITRTG